MIAGVASAAVAVGLGELVAVWTGPRSAPLIAVGGTVIDAVPEPVKGAAISVFGVYDKVALLVGTSLLLAGFAALVGLAARRDFRWGVAGIALFGVIGAVAALTRPNAGAAAVLPSLLGAAAAVGVLRMLLVSAAHAEGVEGPAAGLPDGPVTATRPVDGRRRFLRLSIAGFGVALVSGYVGRALAARKDVQQARAAITLPPPATPAPALPSTVDPPASGLSDYVTGNDVFYRIDTALIVPQVDPAAWQLRIHGRVARPMTLSFEQLLARPMIERYITLACVSNEVGGDLIGNARWLGVPLKDLLDEAGPLDGADQVVSRSVDGWTCGTPTAALRDGRDAMLAVAMNGEPLPVDHGFPVRMVVPGLYGYVSATKWVTELELSSFADFDAYWVRKGWAAQGPIKTESRIDTPREGGAVTAGTVVVAGVAWAQHRGVTAVEVRVDDGPWQPADLAGTVSPDTWRQWTFRWDAAPGEHTLAVRAADTSGQVQTEARADPFPDGASGWHTVSVQVR
ncbi:molybdopterin-dependent oxidoreductase [Catellatospora sichuanensis]|uniref:molybdopterin-dependent oxidoreductase n=1 Tax=Catellatospora sichuanensis TaxID=1969805 RepID=UPI0011829A97|nr:molybdopterin-dependent oxidoreductase [Catellatospora sichuanensis]